MAANGPTGAVARCLNIVALLILFSCCCLGFRSAAAEQEPTPPQDTPAARRGVDLSPVLAYATSDNDNYVQELVEFASIPSISALPDHASDVLAAAAWLKKRLVVAGLENVQVLDTGGAQPVVYADWLHAGAEKPTVLIYGHYDVQPVDPLELWDSPPFAPQQREGFLYGRGVDDNKMSCLQAIHAAEAYLTVASKVPVNIKFLLEGQEEIGSPHLANFLSNHAQGLLYGIDLVLNADGGQVSATQPGICTGLRGAAALEVTVTTAAADMHSGMKGGSVQNANHALIQLLSGLWDRPLQQTHGTAEQLLARVLGKGTHRVNVPGFYDRVAAMTSSDKADVAAFPFDEGQEQQALGVGGFMGEAGFNTLERRWYRPTLEVVGMWGGFTGQGMKTVIPRVASAKLSTRLVPNMTPEDTTAKVKAYLEASAPPHTNVTVQILGFKANPWVSPKDTLGNKVAAAVLERVFNKAPVFYRDGGTIPALAYFQSILGVETTSFGFGLGDHIHAPNERTPVSQIHVGRVAFVEMLAALADNWPAQQQPQQGQKPQHKRRASPSPNSSPAPPDKAPPGAADVSTHQKDDKQEL